MEPMSRRTFLRLAVLLAGFGLAVSSLAVHAQSTDKRGRKYKSPPPTARIEITVVRDTSSKPIENAAVVFHPMEGERDKGNMELKTNEEGKAVIDVIPIGDVVRLQVIAKGFQTHGQDFKVDKDKFAIEVRMRRPGEQYSIYKNHSQASDAAPKSDKPADSAKQPDPGQPQPK
jgi:hypothetical protein